MFRKNNPAIHMRDNVGDLKLLQHRNSSEYSCYMQDLRGENFRGWNECFNREFSSAGRWCAFFFCFFFLMNVGKVMDRVS